MPVAGDRSTATMDAASAAAATAAAMDWITRRRPATITMTAATRSGANHVMGGRPSGFAETSTTAAMTPTRIAHGTTPIVTSSLVRKANAVSIAPSTTSASADGL